MHPSFFFSLIAMSISLHLHLYMKLHGTQFKSHTPTFYMLQMIFKYHDLQENYEHAIKSLYGKLPSVHRPAVNSSKFYAW